jgi:glycosyltransferase involved in cell wall biosynthesis
MKLGLGLLNQAQARSGIELFEARVGARLVAMPAPWTWRVYTRGVRPPEFDGLAGFEEAVCPPRGGFRGARLVSEQWSWGAELRRRPVDLLACLAYFPPRLHRGPFVMTVHDLSPLERPADYPPVTSAYAHEMLRHLAPRALRLTMPSHWVRTRCAEALGFPMERMDVVYSGVEPRYFAARPEGERLPEPGPAIPPGDFWLSCGTLQPRKNLEVALRAIALLVQRQGEAPALVCVGGLGAHGARLASLAHRLGISSRLVLAGRVDDAWLAHLYRTCSAFVYPSWLEGFGVPPLEAMAAGARVVSSNTSCLPEILGDTPVWADPADPESWCAAWDRLRSESPAESAANRARAREWAARYTWDDTARRWRESLDRAVAELGAHR